MDCVARDGRAGSEAGQEMPTPSEGNSKLPARKCSHRRARYDPAIFYPCTNTAFISCKCFVSTSLFVTIGALCVGWPLNMM